MKTCDSDPSLQYGCSDLKAAASGISTRARRLARVLRASETLGTLLLVADAEDQEAAGFYHHFDFIPFPSHPLRLFLPVGTVYGLWRDRK